MHRANKGFLGALFSAYARGARGRSAGLDDPGQLSPIPEAMRLVLGHRQDTLRARRSQQSPQPGREGVAVAPLREQSQRDQGIEQNGEGAQVALKSARQRHRRQRLGGQGVKQVQLRRGAQNRRALVTASQGQYLLSRPGFA